jgi:hypothetical protein
LRHGWRTRRATGARARTRARLGEVFLDLGTMQAILGRTYRGDHAALLKLKAEDLKLKLFPHLELLRANTASADA